MGFAGFQCRTRPRVTRRHVIQDEDIGAGFPIAEGNIVGDGLLDPLHAGLDVRDQRHEIGNDRVMEVLIASRGSAACCVVHERSPLPGFLCLHRYLCVKSRSRTNTGGDDDSDISVCVVTSVRHLFTVYGRWYMTETPPSRG